MLKRSIYHRVRAGIGRAISNVLSVIPVVRRRVSPFHLRRVSSFADYCEEVHALPANSSSRNFYLQLHDGEKRLQRNSPICLDDEERTIFRTHLQSLAQGDVEPVPQVFLAGLYHASILNNGITICSHDNFLLWDSLQAPWYVANCGLSRPFLPRVDLKLDGEYVHLAVLWGSGHYHWVLDLLPRLLFLERFDRFRNLPLIVQRDITKAQRESLEILGIPPQRVIEFDGQHWQVERLYYVCPGWCGNPTSLAAQWLRKRFVPHGTGSRRLYLSRNDASQRRVVNEADLLEALLPLGFEVVTLAGMSFAEQVRLFSEAKIVVGPHGGGLTNIVFAAPGTVVVELFSPTYINGCFWALANACGHIYGFSVGTACDDDIRVNVHKLIRLFSLIEKEHNQPMGFC